MTILLYSPIYRPKAPMLFRKNWHLNIVYEDEEMMVINKPAGMVVHPGSGNYSGTLLNGVAYYLQQKNPGISEETLAPFWIGSPH